MKLFKNIMNICAAMLVALPFVACQQEELVKPSALMSDSSLTFAATGAEAQTFTIASDAYWMIDVSEDWLTVEPMEGCQTQQVTVYVNDNVKNGAVDKPRQATLTIADLKGYSVKTVIYQKGDNYLGVIEMPISSVRSLEDGEFAKVSDAQVVALTSEGFVATDATASLYVTSDAEVSLGDNVYLAGEKSTLYGNAVLKAGDVTVKSNSEVTHPSAIDLAANLDPANANKVVYISTYAGLLGTSLKHEPSLPVSVSLLDPKTGMFDLEAVNMHNVAIEAYFIGLDKGEVKLALTKFEDNGINENLKAYFYDDFSWMKPFLEDHASKGGKVVGDSVGEDNPSAEAPNLRTTATLENLLDELIARGYEDLNSEAKVIYPQAYYWKFGKTSTATANNNGGMKLPQLELQGSDLVNIDLEFDWSPHMTGSGNIDKVSVVAEIVEGSGSFDNGTKVSDPFLNECVKGDLKWHHVKTMIRGANNTTRIVIRPYEYASVTPDQQRWHLDNIKVADSDIPYSDPVYANVSLSEELVTFEGVPAGPVELTIKSDNPWTLTKSVDADWFEIDVTEGAAGEEVKVTVTCQSSTVSTLRKGSIMLASADTRKNIYVVQSAAGGELAPLVSIVGGNKGSVGYAEGTFTLSVQANVHYEVESDASWVTVEKLPATKAIVETTDVLVTYEANTAEVGRTAKIRVYNTLDNLETVYTLTQAAYESGIYFQDDFTWVAPWADAYGSADSVADDNASGKAPNVYTHATHQEYDGSGKGVEGYSSFLAEYAKRGYVDVNPSATSFYTQKYYLKFGATNKHTGIKLPPMELEGATATDVVLTFDWSAHMTSSGNIDKVKIVVELEGDGVCGDSRAKISNPISPDQAKGDLKWQPVKMTLKGVTSNTRIIIRPTHLVDHDGITQQRWYIDNIKVAKKEPVPPIASFPFPKDPTFTGTGDGAGTKWNLSEGWILSEDGKSKLSAHKADGTPMSITYKWEASSDEGKTKDHVRALATGFTKGGYWLFEVPVKDMPAGYYTIKYKQSSSNTGANYFLLEVSLDGKNWAPVDAKTSSETYKDGTGARDVTYTYALNRLGKNAANIAYNVEHTYAAPALPGNNTLYIRAIISDDMEYRATKALASSGTNRIWGPCEVIFEE